MAEDILQETFLKAFTALKDSHTNMRAWLYMVARNLCCNCFRREKKLTYEEPDKGTEAPVQDLLEGILREEQKAELWKAMERLPRQKREVILLQYFGGFSQKEIAAMLRLTPENVRILAHRARKELKSYLEVMV